MAYRMRNSHRAVRIRCAQQIRCAPAWRGCLQVPMHPTVPLDVRRLVRPAYTRTHARTHACIHAHAHTHSHTHTHTETHTHAHSLTHSHARTHPQTRTHTNTKTHARTHTQNAHTHPPPGEHVHGMGHEGCGTYLGIAMCEISMRIDANRPNDSVAPHSARASASAACGTPAARSMSRSGRFGFGRCIRAATVKWEQ